MSTFSLFLRRLGALFYDAFLALAVLMVAGAVASAFMDLENAGSSPLYKSYLFLVLFLFFGGFWMFGGQTLGMRAWRLRVLRIDGKPAGAWYVLLKFLYPSATVFLLLISFEPTLAQGIRNLSLLAGIILLAGNYMAMFFNNEGRSLQDVFSYTKVMYLPKDSSNTAN